MLLTGQEINNYIVGPLIGGGGMGSVYQAFHMDGGQAVAIKIINSDIATLEGFSERFVREARIMSSLQHENIVPIYEAGVHKEWLYFTMKLISGPTLEALMTKRSFSPRDVWKILQPAGKALSYLHEQGVVHRDVKPGNLFLERQGADDFRVYLGDFGLSKRPNLDSNLTKDGARIGTTEYMSPEASLGDRLDHRTDIYSLAVMIYELLLNVLPENPKFGHLKPVARLIQKAWDPCEANPQFPPALRDVLMKGLQKERDLRYQTAADFAQDYYEALKTLGDEARKASYAVVPPPLL